MSHNYNLKGYLLKDIIIVYGQNMKKNQLKKKNVPIKENLQIKK